ncbi:RNA polymerase sigma-70 factor [uncultured Alistipes sp.]|jgi:RNA polymerase sigma-70 factor (ECF subfamily)|uniref:RNA polymerase sigma-70 factor n=1 Tax=Alistipes sp. TaxID=1872444 RepID=UPI0025D9ADDB|nr:RNA polymerase sigma-70 factor [uncultured Alistipes sp.]
MEKIPLISRVREGDREAFDQLCTKYYPMLVSYARLFLKDDWAEDVVQDVFYNVWQRRETLDDSNSLYKYLLRSVYNRSLNYLDKNKRASDYRNYYQERIASMGSAYYAPDNSPVIKKLYTDDLRASLDAAIEALPPKCREVFRLSYIEDLSNREISEQLGISTRTVENHMYSALKQLRRKLSAEQLLLLLSLLFMRGA